MRVSRRRPALRSTGSSCCNMASGTRFSAWILPGQPRSYLRERLFPTTARRGSPTHSVFWKRLPRASPWPCFDLCRMAARLRRFFVPQSKTELWTDSPRFRAMCEAVLAEGAQVRFRVSGMSMQPNLLDGDTVVVAPARENELRRGDVVLTEGKDGLRVHRFISEDAAGGIVTRGDAGQENDPEPQKLAGRVVAIERNGRK